MKIPYGESNFKKVLTGNYLYIDKTRYIEKLEQQGNFNILLRPRRFGKSLFLSSLWHYYDIRYKDDFDSIFSDLYIGGNPTPLKNSYQVLFMDFSGIVTRDPETIVRDFDRKVKTALSGFFRTYGYPGEFIQIIEAQPSPATCLEAFFELVKDSNIYFLIDEYDHFANTVLGENLDLFSEIIGKGGFVRAFYETIKTAALKGVVDRLFITGVTSITLDSLTSGFNIGKNLSHRPNFNCAIGFTGEEVEGIIQPLVSACDLDRQQLMAEMTKWYNGYQFSTRAEERVYNSDMILYFVGNFDLEDCRYPERMLDDNIASDYGNIMRLFAIGDRESNYNVLEELIVKGEITGLHKTKLDIVKSFDRDDFISLLLSMGFITMKDALLNEIRFVIPNYVIQKLYYDYFKVEVEQRGKIDINAGKLTKAVRELALANNIAPFAEEITKALSLFSNRDYMRMDEKHIKAVILTLLYGSNVYYIKSEPEINNKYPDILLLERNPFKVNHQFLFELKYSKKKDGERGWKSKKAEGLKQVREYLQLPDIKGLEKLKSYVLLTNGSDVSVIPVE